MFLTSYVQGAWQAPTPAAADSGTAMHDAVTDEALGRVSTEGIDLAGALTYARDVGGPAVRAVSTGNRAALLKALASFLREHRDELYALSARTGATRSDSAFDVDGGIGVLFTYAGKGKRELAPEGVLVGQRAGHHRLRQLRSAVRPRRRVSCSAPLPPAHGAAPAAAAPT